MLLGPATKGTRRFSAFQICEFLDFVCPAGVRGKRASMPMWGACPSCSWKFLAFLSGKPWKTLGIYGIYGIDFMACCDGKPWLWHGFGYDMCSPWLSTRLFQWYGCCLGVFPLTFSSIEGTWCIDTTWYMTNFQGQTSVETNSSEDQAVPMGSPSTSLLSGRHAGHADGRGMTWATSEPKSANMRRVWWIWGIRWHLKTFHKSMDWRNGKIYRKPCSLKIWGEFL